MHDKKNNESTDCENDEAVLGFVLFYAGYREENAQKDHDEMGHICCDFRGKIPVNRIKNKDHPRQGDGINNH